VVNNYYYNEVFIQQIESYPLLMISHKREYNYMYEQLLVLVV